MEISVRSDVKDNSESEMDRVTRIDCTDKMTVGGAGEGRIDFHWESPGFDKKLIHKWNSSG